MVPIDMTILVSEKTMRMLQAGKAFLVGRDCLIQT